jgi:hypothetical protein
VGESRCNREETDGTPLPIPGRAGLTWRLRTVELPAASVAALGVSDGVEHRHRGWSARFDHRRHEQERRENDENRSDFGHGCPPSPGV